MQKNDRWKSTRSLGPAQIALDWLSLTCGACELEQFVRLGRGRREVRTTPHRRAVW